MSIIYLETSAALAWMLGETRSKEVVTYLDRAEVVVSSVLTLIEGQRVLSRTQAAGLLQASLTTRLRAKFLRTAADWQLMEITDSIQVRASQPFPQEPLRTLDAIHIATALEFAKAYQTLAVLTFDERIRANLIPVGIAPAIST